MHWTIGLGNAALRQSTVLASLALWQFTARPAHGDLLPISFRDWLGFVLAAGALLIAAGGGIGGGALLVPICMIVLGAQSLVHVPAACSCYTRTARATLSTQV